MTRIDSVPGFDLPASGTWLWGWLFPQIPETIGDLLALLCASLPMLVPQNQALSKSGFHKFLSGYPDLPGSFSVIYKSASKQITCDGYILLPASGVWPVAR